MVASIAMGPITPGSAALLNHRHRPAMGEKPMLPDSTPESTASPRSDDRNFLPSQRPRQAEPPAEPERSRTADFAAAVIAGALLPTPKSMDELIRRIGTSEIPEESQARLKDLLA